MSQRHLLVTAAVAALCSGILVLFTDIEVGLVRWVNCGTLSPNTERQDRDLCR
ncbi:MAG: hypothetical protein ACKOBY_05145 [Cyanobium sp.]